MTDEEQLLVDREEYLSNGVHIGAKGKNKDMEKYIFHVKKNQLAVLNLDQTDQRIRKVGSFLSNFNPEEILVVGRKEAAQRPLTTFSEEVGAERIAGRFMPGTLTNPNSENFREPEVVLVSDPEEDAQAIDEAVDAKIPVVAIADSKNSLEHVDLAIPANNKAENSLGMVYFLLAQQIKENRGEEMEYELNDYRPEPEEETDEEDE
ncbi:MAG: 30S ribosomal protein S2 [Candidatus Nanohaloarchaea archaeon]